MIRKVLVPGVAMAAVMFTAWQVYGKLRYDQLRDRLETPAFTIRPIDAESAEFIRTVKESWLLHQEDSPDPIFAEISKITGLDETVGGVAKFYTHEIPEYSFVDLRKNANEAVIATTLMVSIPQSLDGQFYAGEGIGFVKLGANHVELFEDTEDGLSRSLYINQEGLKQGREGNDAEPAPREGADTE
ncbi:MAG: hypothetical protein ACR2RV_02465 [Verrucomicrobiales bacterium]